MGRFSKFMASLGRLTHVGLDTMRGCYSLVGEDKGPIWKSYWHFILGKESLTKRPCLAETSTNPKEFTPVRADVDIAVQNSSFVRGDDFPRKMAAVYQEVIRKFSSRFPTVTFSA